MIDTRLLAFTGTALFVPFAFALSVHIMPGMELPWF